jgi:subtilisin family serine protease
VTRLRRISALALAALVGTVGGTLGPITFAGTTPAAATPGPTGAPEYWFNTWQIPQLWSDGARGQGITIAEIDTGVNAKLPELAGNVIKGIDLGVGGNGQIDRQVSTFGHGTAMASIMVAQPGLLGITGIAPDAKLLPIAIPLKGTTDVSGDDHLAEAIRYAADHGAKVISMSLGGARTPAEGSDPCPTDEQSAIYYALSKGAVLFAAAGNSGQSGNAVEEPGVCLGVVAVGAVDRSGLVASFSSRHPYVTLAAPGVNVPSLSRVLGSAFAGQGTSQATAIASAVAAIVWSKYPGLTGRQLVARILATLDQPNAKPTTTHGYGIINAERAVTADVSSSASDPVYSAVAPFLARFRASTAAANGAHSATSPPPAPTRPIGTFAIGAAPRLLAPAVVRGIVLSAVGVVALLALAVLARIGRRRQSAQLATATRPVPVLPYVDESGLVWREITAPPARPTSSGSGILPQ